MLQISALVVRVFALFSRFLDEQGYVYSAEERADSESAEEFNELAYCENELEQALDLFKKVSTGQFEAYFNSFPPALGIKLDYFQRRLDSFPARVTRYLELRAHHAAVN